VKKTIAAIACATALAGGSSAFAAGDIDAGKEKAFTCTGCHAVPGMRNAYPPYTVPKLGGQHAEYLAAALTGYKSKERSHATMQAQAATLSEQDILDIAAYFASLGAD
jgi:cytochrome c553